MFYKRYSIKEVNGSSYNKLLAIFSHVSPSKQSEIPIGEN